MVIAVDGTSASGKSTIAKKIAEKTSFRLLNTGLIYRKITKNCINRGIDANDVVGVVEVAKTISISDIEDDSLHHEEISRLVPIFAKIPEVRAEVRKFQQSLGKHHDIIIEGRDIGTVVFPNADFKFFITASLEERARRRQKQLGSNDNEELKSIMRNLEERDHQDEHRSNSPLTVADDAESIDTTNLTIEEVIERIISKIRKSA